MKQIICYGDSNTFGFNPQDGSRYDANTRWTGILAKILGDKFNVIEEGFNNRTGFFVNPEGYLQSGQKYLPECLEKNKCFEIFIIALGTNDLQKFFKMDADIVKKGLENLIKIVRSFNSEARLILIPPVVLNENILKGNFSHQFDEKSIYASVWVQAIYKTVADKNDCEFMDLNKYVEPSVVDGLHFDKESHKLIAKLLAERVLNERCLRG